MRASTSSGCSMGATCVPPGTIRSSPFGSVSAIAVARNDGVNVSRSPATTSTGTSTCGRMSPAVCSPAARSMRRNIGKSTWVMCDRYGSMSSAWTRSGSISPALSASLSASCGGSRLQTARTTSGAFSARSTSFGSTSSSSGMPWKVLVTLPKLPQSSTSAAHAFGPLPVRLERDLAAHRVPEEHARRIARRAGARCRGPARAPRCRCDRDRPAARCARGPGSASAPGARAAQVVPQVLPDEAVAEDAVAQDGVHRRRASCSRRGSPSGPSARGRCRT